MILSPLLTQPCMWIGAGLSRSWLLLLPLLLQYMPLLPLP
jgi:hypothetical protein